MVWKKTLAMEKQLRKGEGDRPMASWEIDLAKLDIHHRESPGSFGSFCSATYNGRQVLGSTVSLRSCLFLDAMLFNLVLVWHFESIYGSSLLGFGHVHLNSCE